MCASPHLMFLLKIVRANRYLLYKYSTMHCTGTGTGQTLVHLHEHITPSDAIQQLRFSTL